MRVTKPGNIQIALASYSDSIRANVVFFRKYPLTSQSENYIIPREQVDWRRPECRRLLFTKRRDALFSNGSDLSIHHRARKTNTTSVMGWFFTFSTFTPFLLVT